MRGGRSLRRIYGYDDDWGTPGPQLRKEIDSIMAEIVASETESGPPTQEDQPPVQESEGHVAPMP